MCIHHVRLSKNLYIHYVHLSTALNVCIVTSGEYETITGTLAHQVHLVQQYTLQQVCIAMRDEYETITGKLAH